MWEASPPTFSNGFAVREGRLDPPKSTMSGPATPGDKDKFWSFDSNLSFGRLGPISGRTWPGEPLQRARLDKMVKNAPEISSVDQTKSKAVV